ncbi:MAG: YihY/virulence factor BrkB family protein [Streptosporangiaceae bacterium]
MAQVIVKAKGTMDFAVRTLEDVRRRSRFVDHLGRAYGRYDRQRGDRLAAELSFYGFLAFFPLTALAFAVVGYTVVISPGAADYVNRAINDLLPGLADQLQVKEVATAKTGAGLIGLAGLAWAGLGWMSVWRESLRSIWLVDPTGGGNYFVKKLWDLLILYVLGLIALASVASSSLATTLTHVVLSWVGLDEIAGAGTLLRLISVAVGIAANLLIILVLFSRLSGTQATWRRLVKGALFGAVGFEVLKVVGALLIGVTTHNKVYASFAVLVGLLVWINVTSRFILFTAAWTATRSLILQADADHPELSLPPVIADAHD